MTRVKRGDIAKKRRKNILAFVSGSRGAHSSLFKAANQQKMRALVSAHRDRIKRKRDFRRLWITRINAVASRDIILSYRLCYNRFIDLNLIVKSELIDEEYRSEDEEFPEFPFPANRKTFAQIAIFDSQFIEKFSELMDLYIYIQS
uniref:Large ribosomal subunit protein bL20c n=1 Tax=Callitris rhomboidea TaxID=13383 RepID=A0A1Y1BD96_9CONI|nr:ribosomal protein L20 [Callitris rhomboidea]BAX56319.1 ribosomal protein L20 [Callitris rhomboidea]